MQWPDSIIEAVKLNNIVYVIGAGFSAGSIAQKDGSNKPLLANDNTSRHPPGWDKLLLSLSENAPEQYKKQIEAAIDSERYLEAAELLSYSYTKNSNRRSLQNQIKKLVDEPETGYRYQTNPWHKELIDLNPRIIITTNYDLQLKRAFPEGFKHVKLDDTGIPRYIKFSEPTVVHFHGSVENLDTIVLSQSDYILNERKYSEFFNIIESLMKTKVFLFLGYSLQDPDMLMLLQKTSISGSDESRFILTDDGLEDYKREMFINSYGVNVLTYKYTEDHSEGVKALKELVEIVMNP